MNRLSLVLALFVVVCASCAAVQIQPIKIEGMAMAPALNDGDRIIIDRGFEKLERGDIVVFLYPADQSKSFIKRIVGLPNETVEIRDGTVVVNGTSLDEPYVDPKLNESQRSLRELTLPADAYFVMGDNRDNSNDSRMWGPLKREFIYGRYVKKYFAASP